MNKLAFALAFTLPSIALAQILPADRDASANWKMAGMQSVGGIPNRTIVCGTTVLPRGGGQDDTANIQNAINACPIGQVVQLSAGTFTIAEGNHVQISKGITLRGAGPTQTILQRTNGAQVGTYFPGSAPSPIISINGNNGSGSTTALTTDAAKGVSQIQVSNATGYQVDEIVLLDEASGAGWNPERNAAWAARCPQIWTSPDYRVEWMRHNPSCNGDDGSDIFAYFQIHPDHPTNEMHRITAISGNVITFDDPVMISYRTSHGAQIAPAISGPLNAGVESLAVKGGDDSNIKINTVAYAWVKDVENSYYLNDGFRLEQAYRIQLENVYVHHAAWPVNGGAGYNISLAYGTSEVLIENSISVLANKVMVARASGAGSVIAYNYMDDGFISGSDGWVEIGLNASHLAGPHHVLFEGNQSWNMDSDSTHGASIYMTFFRNWATGFRARFTDYLNNQVVDDVNQSGNGPKRAASAHQYSNWFSFIANVLGTQGKMGGWVYEDNGGTNRFPNAAIWTLGYFDVSPQGTDPQVSANVWRDGNWDFVSNSQKWDASDTTHTLPDSLYLRAVPEFFGSSCSFPWVNPTTGATATLPAKARFDAGAPITGTSCTGTASPPPSPPAPTASLSANPTSITAGQSSTLTWSSTNATACAGGGFDTGDAISGSASVTPPSTTIYSVSCTGSVGSASATATVTLGSAPPPSPIPGTFQIGARVTTTADAQVDQSPNHKILCTQPTGAMGNIIGAPQTGKQGGKWWQINYDTGCDGWTRQGLLAVQ